MAEEEAPAKRAGSPFRDGLMSMALNPKCGVFFVAVVPQFVEPGPGAAGRVALLLCVYGVLCVALLVGLRPAAAHASSPGARRSSARSNA